MPSAVVMIVALGSSACASDPQALLLDHICDPDSENEFDDFSEPLPPPPGPGQPDVLVMCSTSGDVEQRSGVTADAIAFHFGPATGALHLHLSAFEAIRDPNWSLEILARSTRPEGSEMFRVMTWSTCAACPPDPGDATGVVTGEFSWVRAVDNESGMSDAFASLPNDAMITLRGADLDIVNVRTPR